MKAPKGHEGTPPLHIDSHATLCQLQLHHTPLIRDMIMIPAQMQFDIVGC